MHQAGREYSHISLSLAETEHALPISVEERNMIKCGICFILAAENCVLCEQQGNNSVNDWKRETRSNRSLRRRSGSKLDFTPRLELKLKQIVEFLI